jgi:chromosome segregation ATPase
MNIFIKLLFVFIFVMSAVFLGLTATAFNHRQNYKTQFLTKIDEIKEISTKDNKEIERLKSELNTAESKNAEKENEIKSLEQKLTEASTELQSKQKHYADLQTENKTLNTEHDELSRNIDAESKRNEDLHREFENYRKRFQEAENDLNMLSAKLIENKDELVRNKKNLAALDNQYIELSRKYNQSQELLDYYKKLNIKEPVEVTKTIRAKIAAVSEKLNIVLITAGEDEGVKVGMEFTVYRENKFIAKVRVDKVDKKHCTAIPIEGLAKDIVKEQDDVTTNPF